MKKLIHFIVVITVLSVVLIMGTAVVNATESGQCGDNITWTLDDSGTLTLSGTGPMYDYSDTPFNYKMDFNRVIIEPGITTIGNNAFYNSNLESIEIPESVTSIGDWSLGGTDLENVTIPDSVQTIGECAFVLDRQLESIVVPDGVTSIGYNAFGRCDNLKSIRFPSGLTTINGLLLSYCVNLEDVVIPDSVTNIGVCAFQFCSSLKNITIPPKVDSIGREAFYGCAQMTTVEVPESVSEIGESAFGYTNNKPYEENKRIEGFIIKGYSGSAVHAYAVENGIEFISTGRFVPKAISITKITKAKKSFTVQWKRSNQSNCGYQLQYALKSNFKGASCMI